MSHALSWVRVSGAYRRRMARWFGRRPFELNLQTAVISFTFDDFPESALAIAGRALEAEGVAGTYYVAHGLAGQNTPTGKMFAESDLPELLQRGHEISCHTFHHHPAWETAPARYEASVVQNARSLEPLLHSRTLESHSYPISYPRPATKRRIGPRFRGCRAGGQTFNQESVDLNHLSSFFLEQSRDDFAAVERIIAANALAKGWLIFSTHDVAPGPTRFGCTPDFFTRVLNASVRSGARLLPVSAALDAAGVAPLEPRATLAGSPAGRSATPNP